MERFDVAPAVPADAAAVTEVVATLESSLYPRALSSFSQNDLEDEWSSIDLERDSSLTKAREL